MRVRNYIPGEDLPKALRTGYESDREPCDPRWIWLVEDGDGVPCAILVTSPAHIAVVLIRLVALDSAPRHAVGELLRHSLAEAKSRGYSAYVTWVNPQRPAEASLLGLIRATGGIQATEIQVGCLGLTEGRLPEGIACHL